MVDCETDQMRWLIRWSDIFISFFVWQDLILMTMVGWDLQTIPSQLIILVNYERWEMVDEIIFYHIFYHIIGLIAGRFISLTKDGIGEIYEIWNEKWYYFIINLKNLLNQKWEKELRKLFISSWWELELKWDMILWNGNFDDQPISLFISQKQICKMAGYYLSRACVITTRLISW